MCDHPHTKEEEGDEEDPRSPQGVNVWPDKDHKLCILSIDVGVRKLGITVLRCWWEAEADVWPCVEPLVLLGDPIIPKVVQDMKTFGEANCVKATIMYFRHHAKMIFGYHPDIMLIERQPTAVPSRFRTSSLTDGKRIISSVANVMFTLCHSAHRLYPELRLSDRVPVRVCSATYKTTDLERDAEDGDRYAQCKQATLAKAMDMLSPTMGARINAHDSRIDIADAFMQAVGYFRHQYQRAKRKGKPRVRPRLTKPPACVSAEELWKDLARFEWRRVNEGSDEYFPGSESNKSKARRATKRAKAAAKAAAKACAKVKAKLSANKRRPGSKKRKAVTQATIDLTSTVFATAHKRMRSGSLQVPGSDSDNEEEEAEWNRLLAVTVSGDLLPSGT